MNLTDLRPTGTVDPDGLDSAHRILHARVAADPAADRHDAHVPRRRPAATRWVAVGAAAVAATVVAVALPGPADAPAFAGWTPVPASASAADLVAAGQECLALRDADAGGERIENLAGARPVVTDRRGETTFTVLASDAGLQSCLIGPGTSTSMVVTGDSGSTASSGSGSGSGSDEYTVGVVGGDTAPAADAATYVSGGIESTASAAPWSWAVGRVGADVTQVEVGLADGSTVTASVNDGVWAAWWPGESLAQSVAPTLADGSAGTAPDVDVVDLEPFVGEQAD